MAKLTDPRFKICVRNSHEYGSVHFVHGDAKEPSLFILIELSL
jgi:hypothetical protein